MRVSKKIPSVSKCKFRRYGDRFARRHTRRLTVSQNLEAESSRDCIGKHLTVSHFSHPPFNKAIHPYVSLVVEKRGRIVDPRCLRLILIFGQKMIWKSAKHVPCLDSAPSLHPSPFPQWTPQLPIQFLVPNPGTWILTLVHSNPFIRTKDNPNELASIRLDGAYQLSSGGLTSRIGAFYLNKAQIVQVATVSPTAKSL